MQADSVPPQSTHISICFSLLIFQLPDFLFVNSTNVYDKKTPMGVIHQPEDK